MMSGGRARVLVAAWVAMVALWGAAEAEGGTGPGDDASGPDPRRPDAGLIAQRDENERLRRLSQDSEQAREAVQTQLAELESRLTRQGRSNEALRSELERLKGHLAQTGARLEAIQGQSQAAAERLAELNRQRAARDQSAQQLRDETARLRTELEQGGRQLAALERAGKKVSAERAALETAHQAALGRIEGLERELAVLKAAEQSCRARLDAANTELAALETARDKALAQVPALQEALTEAKVLLGPDEGGAAELASTRERVSALAKAYMDEFRRQREAGGSDPAVSGRLLALSNRLFAAQTLVARLMRAQAVYTLRPQDTLTTLAAYFYGSEGRWRELYDSNGYALEDADLLVPGLVLVIP